MSPGIGMKSAAARSQPTARGPAEARVLLPAQRVLGWAAMAALLAALVTTPGCRTGRAAPRLPDLASVEALLRDPSVAGGPLSARGRATVRLRAGGRELPALGGAFSLREAGELGLVLRPGVLPPVLSLWAGADGWLLTLPRDKTAFETAHAPGLRGMLSPGPAPESGSSATPSGPTMARIASWALGPYTLLDALSGSRVRSEGAEWVVTGRVAELGVPDLWLEVRLDAAAGAISRWSLKSEDATEMVAVNYDPPRERRGCGRAGQRIRFALPTMALDGQLTLEHIRCTAPAPRERPAVPEGWACRPGADLLPALTRLQADLESES